MSSSSTNEKSCSFSEEESYPDHIAHPSQVLQFKRSQLLAVAPDLARPSRGRYQSRRCGRVRTYLTGQLHQEMVYLAQLREPWLNYGILNELSRFASTAIDGGTPRWLDSIWFTT